MNEIWFKINKKNYSHQRSGQRDSSPACFLLLVCINYNHNVDKKYERKGCHEFEFDFLAEIKNNNYSHRRSGLRHSSTARWLLCLKYIM